MITFTGWRRRSVRRAFGVVSVTAALLAASTTTENMLGATQDEAASPADSESVVDTAISQPDDLSEERIEAVDMALADVLTPKLNVLFDAAQPVEARKAAAAEILEIASGISPTTRQAETLRRKLIRRTALLQAALSTADVSTAPGTDDLDARLLEAVNVADAMLRSVGNHEAWLEYLHISELQSGATPEVRRQVLRNLTPSDRMNREQLSFIIRPSLQGLKAALESSLAAAAYADSETAARDGMNSAVATLVNALIAYEKQSLAGEAETARSAWRALRSRFPAAADILRPVVNTQYFNHNVHFTVSEDLLSRLVSDYRTESGRVADCILGAWVTGTQTTSVDVRADIRPSATTARFDLNVTGNTLSNTRAQKSPATVWTNGNHHFWMNRSVHFDGRKISASSAAFQADTNSRTVGLATKYDGIPIVRGIVRNMAVQRINESKPQSEAITADRLKNEALPKFQSETDKQFAESNDTLKKMLDSLDRRGVAPDSISSRSSESHIAVSSRTIGIDRIGGSLQPPAPLTTKGATLQIHESALNNAIDALQFQGREIPEKDFVVELESALSDLFQREIKLSDGESVATPDDDTDEPPTVFLFSKSDPIRVRFDDGHIVLHLRTGIRQEGKEEIPVETVTIPISMTLLDGKIIVEPGNIAVTGRPTRSVQIKRVLARRIVRKELSPTIDLQAAGDKTLPVTVTRIEMADGWLTTEVQ